MKANISMNLRYASLTAIIFCVAFFSTAGAQQQVMRTKVLRATTTFTGTPIVFPAIKSPEVAVDTVEIAPGASVPARTHPNPYYVYILEGTLTVVDENGKAKEYPAGSFLVSQNSWGIPKNLGSVKVKTLSITQGEPGDDNTVTKK